MQRKINAILFLGLLLGILALSFQNCGGVNLGAPSADSESKPGCSDLSASRPENIYADASTDPNTVIFRMNERDNNNFLTTSNRVFEWSVLNGTSLIEGGQGNELELLLNLIPVCTTVEVRAKLRACGEDIQWKLNYTKQNSGNTCVTTTTVTVTSTTNTSTTVQSPTTTQPTATTLPAHQQPNTGGAPPSCQSSGGTMCAPPISGTNGTTMGSNTNGNIGLLLAGMGSPYGQTYGAVMIPPNQKWVVPFRTGAPTANGASITVFNITNGTNQCMCKFTISKTPGDFRDVLMGPQFRANGGGDYRCMGFTGTEAGLGHPLAYVETTNMTPPPGEYCPLTPNSNYYFNIDCGGRDPNGAGGASYEFPWIPRIGCSESDPLCYCAISSIRNS